MNRTQLACYALLASAFVLAAWLIVRAQDRVDLIRPAHAGMAINHDSISVMTGRTGTDEESLFVIDGFNEKLLIYRADITDDKLIFAGSLDLQELFSDDKPTSRRRRGTR